MIRRTGTKEENSSTDQICETKAQVDGEMRSGLRRAKGLRLLPLSSLLSLIVLRIARLIS